MTIIKNLRSILLSQRGLAKPTPLGQGNADSYTRT